MLQSGVIRLGALGWSNPAWQAAFYPTDMPVEWQLTYFNTQFGCVFLEQSVWLHATPEQRLQWHADTHEQFVFLLETDGLQPQPVELAGKARLLKRDDAQILWFTRDSSLKALAAALSSNANNANQAEEVQPRFLVSLDGDLAQMERVATLLEVMGL